MGVELPPDLAALAAATGAAWPEADEDALRSAATAWRDAATRLTTLTGDADTTASTTLTAFTGAAADAARTHWSAFVGPDSGHLTTTARGCLAAADRLDHAADQVSAAKVEIVRQLVDLAKNTEAAVAVGTPSALLGIKTAVTATAANLAAVGEGLISAVAPNGPDVTSVRQVANANPGARQVAGAVPGVVGGPAGRDSAGLTGGLADAVGGGAVGVLAGAASGGAGGAQANAASGGAVGAVASAAGGGAVGAVASAAGGGAVGAVASAASGGPVEGLVGAVGGRPDSAAVAEPVARAAGGSGGLVDSLAGGVTHSVVGAVGGATGSIAGAVGGPTGGLTGSVAGLAGGATDSIAGAVGGVSNPIVDAVGGVSDSVAGAVSGVAATTGDLTDSVTGAVGGAAGGVTDSIAGAVGGGPAGGLTESIAGAVGGVAGGVTDSIAGAVGGVAGGLTESIAGAVGGVAGGVTDSIAGAVGGVAGGVTDSVAAAVGGVTHSVVGGVAESVGGVADSALNTAGGAADSALQAGSGTVHGVDGAANDLADGSVGQAEPGAPRPGPADEWAMDLPTPPSGMPVPDNVHAASAAAVLDAPSATQAPAHQAPTSPPPQGGAAIPAQGAQAPTAGPVGGPVPGPRPHSGGGGPGLTQPGPTGGGDQRGRPAPSTMDSTAQTPESGFVVPIDARQYPRSQAEPRLARLPGVFAGASIGDTHRDQLSLFLLHLFPIGHLPQVADEPHTQLPAPQAEVDYAAGLRFPPDDHPEAHLVDAKTPAPVTRTDGRKADHLADGYDPLGGLHERDWERRFLVRDADEHGPAEYAWPPGEQYPEGGCADGDPVVLAPGTVVDRLGSPEGRVFAEDGTPFAARSLPPDQLVSGLRRYRVVRPLPVWRTASAPWFAQRGGGIRLRATRAAVELVALGYLVEITEDGQ